MNNSLNAISKSLVTRYKFLREFIFHSRPKPGCLNQGELTIAMMDEDGETIRIVFSGVRNINIRTGPFDTIGIVGLAIEGMEDAQWPDVQMRVVSEDEATYLSFYCLEAVLI